MRAITNINNVGESTPLPTFGNIKRELILGDFRQRLFLFDLAFFDQPLFFCLNLTVQFFASSFFRSLLYELALNGILKNGLLHILRELGIKLFQLFVGCGITVNIRKKFFYLGNDALLFCRGWERN